MNWYILRVNGRPHVLRSLDEAIGMVSVLRITLPSATMTLRKIRMAEL